MDLRTIRQESIAALAVLTLIGVSGAAFAPRFTPEASDPPTLRVMTFNIRYNTPSDSANAWPFRKDMVAGMVRFHDVDVVGMQEALKGQIDDLEQQLPGYAWIGVGRADGREAGEYCPIFYRTERLELLEHGTFWLSETPDVPGSKSWDAAIERIVTWAVFRDVELEAEIFVLNTHFDHIGAEARRRSAQLIADRLSELAGGRPIVVMGDFNTTEDSAPYDILTSGALRDTMTVSELPHYGPSGTWHDFGRIPLESRIDYVFVSDAFRVLRHANMSETWNGRFPSDHLPVLAEVGLADS